MPGCTLPRLLLTLYLSSHYCYHTQAQSPTPKSVSIWEIRDHDNVVYLAGSVHLLRESDLPIPDCYFRAYRECKHVYFELDMKLVGQPEMKQRMLEMAQLPPEMTLSRFIPKETLARLQTYVRSKGVSAKTLNHLKPGMVIPTLSALSAREMGASPDNGIESLIYSRCKEDGTSVSGLETPEYQLSMFDELDPKSLDRLINQAIDDADKPADTLEKLLKAWRHGDNDTLDKLITEKTPRGGNVHDVVMVKRNQNWLPVIEQSIKSSQNDLFLVGAGHLVGPDGIVQMLTTKGYQVTQLNRDSLQN
ncbi:MAG: TraB/GumN family protein [Verrucomicrobiales bacterium]|nr:TraB/GumN family protein [Verrucomicrobiales bacterium]